MKKIYNKPEIEIIYYDHKDIITSSGECHPEHEDHRHHYGWNDPQPGHGNDNDHGHHHGGHR